jgi:hypothetical protein
MMTKKICICWKQGLYTITKEIRIIWVEYIDTETGTLVKDGLACLEHKFVKDNWWRVGAPWVGFCIR